MVAGPPSTENTILCHHVTTVAEKGQKAFAFAYYSLIKIQSMNTLTQLKDQEGTRREFKELSCQQSVGSLS